MLTLTPAYGRDYKSAKDVKAAWDAGKDFLIADMYHPDCGRYINKDDAGPGQFKIRYGSLRKILVIKVIKKAETR